MKNAVALDQELRRAIEIFDLDELLARFIRHQAAISPVNDIAQIFGTPGGIDAPGPSLGAYNRDVLIEQLGFSEAELAAAGIEVDPTEEPSARKRVSGARS